MPEASTPPRAPTPLLKLRRQTAERKIQKLQRQLRVKRYKRLGFEQSVPGVGEVRRAVEDVGEERAAHGVVPFGFGCAALVGRSRKRTACLDVSSAMASCQGGPHKTGRAEPDPAQTSRHSRAEPAYRGGTWRHLACNVSGGDDRPRRRRHPHGLGVRRASTALLLARSRIFTAPVRRQLLLSCAAFGGRGPALVAEQQLRPRREVWSESGAPYGGSGIRGAGKRRRAGGR